MSDRKLVFLCGIAAGFALKGLSDIMLQQPVRRDWRNQGNERRDSPVPFARDVPAGRPSHMAPDWDLVDEQGDESFPASDPPGNY